MNFQNFLKISKKLDERNFFKFSDKIFDDFLSRFEKQPFELKSGLSYNDPKTVDDYFLGYAFDLYSRKPDIRRSELINELKKEFNEKYQTMSEEDKSEYENYMNDTLIPLLEEINFFDNISENDYSFDEEDDNFRVAFEHILNVEGGFTDYNPITKDPRTNLGITQSVYDEFRSKNGLDTQNVSEITIDEAKKIYYDEYWLKINGDYLSQYMPKTTLVLFDIAVNSGPSRALRVLCETLGIQQRSMDSILVQNLKNIVKQFGDENLSKALIDQRMLDYDSIIKGNESLSVYRKGWMNRMDQLSQVISEK